MMNKNRIYNANDRFQTIRDASGTIGLSRHYLRQGCIIGEGPHIKSRKTYMISVLLLIEKPDAQSVSDS